MAKAPVDTSSDALRRAALETLKGVAEDVDAPAAARASAARTMLEAIGAIGRMQDTRRLDEDRSVTEMSPVEINEEILRLSAKLPKVRVSRLKTPTK
jgi:hypothetical protein